MAALDDDTLLHLPEHFAIVTGGPVDDPVAIVDGAHGLVCIPGLGVDELRLLLDVVARAPRVKDAVRALVEVGAPADEARATLSHLVERGVWTSSEARPAQHKAPPDTLRAAATFAHVVVIGGGHLARGVHAALVDNGVDASIITPHTTEATRGSALPAGSGAPALVVVDDHDLDGQLDTQLAALAEPRHSLVVCAVEGASWAWLLARRDDVVARGACFLPVVVARGVAVSAGPVSCPGAPCALEALHLGFLGTREGFAARPLLQQLATGVLSTTEAVGAGADVVVQIVHDASHSGWHRTLTVDGRGPAREKRTEPVRPPYADHPLLDLRKLLQPQWSEPNRIASIRDCIQAGELVVLRNAFREDYAAAMHESLNPDRKSVV